ncbi:MAG TPA: DegT/DnrJ/EryC1/StrS family aminotransferase [Gaiellaceae bacterium]|nr:DegT/DnrJ/EryC1/StrS family aminotransferase [Gaiellaceae bacterium]
MTREAHPTAESAVPFFDLAPSHEDLADGIVEEFGRLIRTGAFINGPQVREFEDAFAGWCGTSACIGMASGLDALRIGLLALGIGRGDEVVAPANTFAATLEAITQVGATPVLVDATFTDYNVDVDAVAAAITSRTAALLPVHLYGQMADMTRLRALADKHGLAVLEDACQAHGATRDGFLAGAAGDAAAFSFYPAKNLGAFGDAGALVTDRVEVAETARALREHGQRAKYLHELQGYTARLDTIQAIALAHKLPWLDDWNTERRELAVFYRGALAGIEGLIVPPVAPGSEPVWHLFVVRVAEPDRLAETLREDGIGTGRHYPYPIHLMPAFEFLGYRRGEFPVTEAVADQCLSLPLFPGMSREQAERVVDALHRHVGRG